LLNSLQPVTTPTALKISKCYKLRAATNTAIQKQCKCCKRRKRRNS